MHLKLQEASIDDTSCMPQRPSDDSMARATRQVARYIIVQLVYLMEKTQLLRHRQKKKHRYPAPVA